MRRVLLVLSHLVLAALASVICHKLDLWPLWPLIFAPFLVYHSLHRPLHQTIIWSLFLGYFTDILTMAPAGFHMMLFSLAVTLIHFVITVTNLPEPLTLTLFAIIFQFIVMIGSRLLLYMADLVAVYPTTASAIMLPQLFLAALFTLLLWPWYRFIYRPDQNGYGGLESKDNVFIGR